MAPRNAMSGPRNLDPESPPSPPSYKRRRTAVACKSCRSRKSRCDGARPSCSLCVELGFRCVYLQPTSGRGSKVPLDDYDERLQALEATIAALVKQNSSLQASQENSDHIESQELGPQPSDAQQMQQHDIGGDVATLDEADHLSHVSPVDGMATIMDPEQPDLRFFGPSSNISFLRHTSSATFEALKAVASSRQGDDIASQPLVSRIPSPAPAQPASEASPIYGSTVNMLCVPSQPHATALIKLFFEDTGRLFPYIYEADVVNYYNEAKERHFTAVSRSWLALLNAIFAIATYVSATPERTADVNAAESKVYIERAQGLLSDLEPKFACIETVQAQVLMVQYYQGTQRSDQTWHLHGLAVRTAMQLGLHSNVASQGLSPLKREIRKRTWFACFIFDRSLSMTFGCAPSIPNDRLNLDLPLNCSLEALAVAHQPSPTSTTATQCNADAVCLLIATIQLFKLQGDVIAKLYNSNIDSDSRLTLPMMLENVLSLEHQLAQWRQDLFPQLQRTPWEETHDNRLSPPSYTEQILDRLSVIVTLRFLNTRILLHRPVLVDFVTRKQAHLATLRPYSCEIDSFFLDLGRQSIKVSEECSMEVVNILRKVKNAPIPWFVSTYYTFNAALVIYNCVLLRLRSPPGTTTNFCSRPGTSDLASTIELIAVLSRAVDAVRSFKGSARVLQRIEKTLLKLVHICVSIGQAHPDYGPSLLSAWPIREDQEALQQGGDRRNDNESAQVLGDMQVDFLGCAGVFAEHDLLAWDTDLHPSWWEEGVNLFNDLGGMESRSTALFPG